jgi:type I restriction enzyme S subunit
VSAFAAIGEFLNGYAFKPSHWGAEGIPIIKIKELKQGVTTATPRYGGVDLDSRYFVDPGELLFSWSADLGVYVWAGERGALNQHLFKVSPAAGIERAYLYYSLEAALPQFRSRAQGTTMKHIKRSALTEVDCVVPDRALQAAFSETVGPMHDQVLTLKNEAARLAVTRDLLLPRLVTGRLDISDIDLGELLPPEAA